MNNMEKGKTALFDLMYFEFNKISKSNLDKFASDASGDLSIAEKNKKFGK